jgi:acyl carrier protein
MVTLVLVQRVRMDSPTALVATVMMYNEQNVRTLLRRYLLSEVLSGEEPDRLTDDTHLQTTGILDSTATLNLVNFLEREFGIEVAAHEVNVSNFDRVSDIVALVARKAAGEGK